MDNDLDSELAPLIISQFIVKLDVMSCQIMNLLFPFPGVIPCILESGVA